VKKFSLKDIRFRFLLAGLLGAFLSLIVMVAAPGNYIRQAYFPDPPDLFEVLSISIGGYLIYLESIFGSIGPAACILGAMFTAMWVGSLASERSKPASQRLWYAFMALFIGFVLAFGCFPSAAYGVSEPPPPRTQIIPSYLLMVGVMAGGLLFGRWLGFQRYGSNAFRAIILFLACMFVIISAWGETKFLASIYEEHRLFAQKWDWVDTKIVNAVQAGAEEVYIPSMKNWAGLEYPSNRLKYWPNVCFTQYYGIKVIAPPQGD
jgi:hypothetical protein